MKILLLGNPNVGKSVVFNRLTDAFVIVSNYPGATVEFSTGHIRLDGERIPVIDVPGIYSLGITSKADEVAVKILDDLDRDDIIINIIDSTNIERGLNLTLQLIKRRIPMLIALNMWDEAAHVGVSIDVESLSKILDLPCVPVTAVSGQGIKNLVMAIPEAKISSLEYEDGEHWHVIGDIINNSVTFKHKHHSFLERLSDLSVNPITGLPLALIILSTVFYIIRQIGEGLIGYFFEPLFENIWKPLLLKLSHSLNGTGLLHNILIGRLVDGDIDFVESLGLLSTGIFAPIGMILPYIFAFYFVLSFLEDSGYLPRLGVLLDTIMHQVGLHGLSIIPMLLGVGCNVPGALASRVLETKRERFIATTLMAIAIPCMAQIAMIIGLIGPYGIKGMFWVFGILLLVWIILGLLMNRFTKGTSPEIFVEIPPYRIPYFSGMLKKVWMRMLWFLKEAVPLVLSGVLLVNIMYSLGIVDFIGNLSKPIITGIMGLPQESVGALVIGFFRKDVAVGMLAPLNLSLKQLVTASVILTMYFPCIATFAVIIKELGIKYSIYAILIMLSSTIIVGGLLNLIPPELF